MSQAIYFFDLCITPNTSPPPVLNLSQYDNSRTFVARLKDDEGNAYNMAQQTAIIKGKNKTGAYMLNTQLSTQTGYADNYVAFTPSGQMTIEPGRFYITLEIQKNVESQDAEYLTPLGIILNIQKAGATAEEIAASSSYENIPFEPFTKGMPLYVVDDSNGNVVVAPLATNSEGQYIDQVIFTVTDEVLDIQTVSQLIN